jgi:anti-sigma factor RsiW
MDCRAVERNLSLFVDGELEDKARLAIAGHLRRCAACESAYRKLTSIQRCLARTRESVSAPEDFSAVVQARLRRVESQSRRMLDGQRASARMSRTVMFTAIGTTVVVAVLVAALAVLTSMLAEKTSSDSTTRATVVQPAGVLPVAAGLTFVQGAPGWLAPPPVSSELVTDRGAEQKPWTSVSY